MTKEGRMKLAVAVPTYNELDNIKKLLPALNKYLKDYPGLTTTVYVIDDGSPDGTADAAEKLGKQLKSKTFSVQIMRRAKKEGLGKAYVYAFKKLIKEGYDYILQMDADLSHNPKYIPQFLDATKDFNFIIGSRYIKGGATPDWQWHRKLLSRGGNIYTRSLLSSKISDYTGGFNLFSGDLLHSLDLDTLQAGGYGFLIELKYRAFQQAGDVFQVPIVFMDRTHGESKLPKGIIFKNLALVARMRFGR